MLIVEEFKAGVGALAFLLFLAEIAESAERFSPDGENHVTQKSRKTQKTRLRRLLLRSLWGTQMAQITQIVFRAFLKLVIGRNYLYLPTEIMNKGRAMHILLGSLEFGSQVLQPFALWEPPCNGVEE